MQEARKGGCTREENRGRDIESNTKRNKRHLKRDTETHIETETGTEMVKQRQRERH